ncbi:MAG TPA: MaoC family dehydratase [Acidimicrobiales bacterium]|nr:MaoC family dehydratase [Acidimicrobiales bacterium]
MEPTVFEGLDELRGAVGTELGPSEWYEITQRQIDLFAEATGDHQWIHVDPERAKAGPFGTTIAHGFLTLSLVAYLLPQVIRVSGISMGINYGANRVRFPAPVPVGSRVRARGTIQSVEDVAGGVQMTTLVTVEVEGNTKPACVVESITRYLG